MKPIDSLFELLSLEDVSISFILFFLIQMNLDCINGHLVFLDLLSLGAMGLLQELSSVKVGAFVPRKVDRLGDSWRLGHLGQAAFLFDLSHVALKVIVEGDSSLHFWCFERW